MSQYHDIQASFSLKVEAYVFCACARRLISLAASSCHFPPIDHPYSVTKVPIISHKLFIHTFCSRSHRSHIDQATYHFKSTVLPKIMRCACLADVGAYSHAPWLHIKKICPPIPQLNVPSILHGPAFAAPILPRLPTPSPSRKHTVPAAVLPMKA